MLLSINDQLSVNGTAFIEQIVRSRSVVNLRDPTVVSHVDLTFLSPLRSTAQCHLKPLSGTCATVYKHWRYRGSRRTVGVGESTNWVGRSWNDEVSSLIVRPGCTFVG